MTMSQGPGHRLRQALKLAADQQQLLPFVGIYDLFSAFGLPDVGFIGWGDLTTTTSRLRGPMPDEHCFDKAMSSMTQTI